MFPLLLFLNHRKAPRKRGGRSCLQGTKNLAKARYRQYRKGDFRFLK